MAKRCTFIPSFKALSLAKPKLKRFPLVLRTIKSTPVSGCFNASSLIVRSIIFAGGALNISPK